MEREIIFEIIDDTTQGVDTYHNNGSVWLIFTDEKKWVIELTKEGTLWYNYYFFQDCFKYVSLDVVDNQHYITEWVENTIQNGVKSTEREVLNYYHSVENTIQNGVKSTLIPYLKDVTEVENTIQNGVKSTCYTKMVLPYRVENTIQNGLKHIRESCNLRPEQVENTIQNGIKKTEYVTHNLDVEKALKNGVKNTESIASHRTWKSEEVIKNSIKETNPHFLEIINPMDFEPTIKEMKRMNEVNIVLDKGIKEVKELPDKSGELRGYGDYYNRQEDRTKPHTQYVDDVVLNGIKETKYCELHSLMRADHIIRDGIKETKSVHIHNGEPIDSVIKNGIKETKRLKDENRPQIENIVKQTNWRKVDNFPDYVDRIIK